MLLGRDPAADGPPWLADDLALALAWRRLQGERCPSCGTRHRDWYDDDGEPREEPLVAATIRQCAGCDAASRASDSIAKGSRGAHVQFLPIEIVRRQLQRRLARLRLVGRSDDDDDD